MTDATPYRVNLRCIFRGHNWRKVAWDHYQCRRCGKQRHVSWFREST